MKVCEIFQGELLFIFRSTFLLQMFSKKCFCKENISKFVRPLLAALSVNGLILTKRKPLFSYLHALLQECQASTSVIMVLFKPNQAGKMAGQKLHLRARLLLREHKSSFGVYMLCCTSFTEIAVYIILDLSLTNDLRTFDISENIYRNEVIKYLQVEF